MKKLLIMYSIGYQAQQFQNCHPPLQTLILRSGSRPWAGLWTGSRAFLPWLGSAVILLWGRGVGGRFCSALLLPVLHWGGWATAGLLFAGHLLGSAAGIPFGLYLWAALWTGLWFTLSWARPWFVWTWTRFGFARSRTGLAVARAWFALSWLGARFPSRSGAGMATSLVAARTRSVKNKRNVCNSHDWTNHIVYIPNFSLDPSLPGVGSGATPGAPAPVASTAPAAGAAAAARSEDDSTRLKYTQANSPAVL